MFCGYGPESRESSHYMLLTDRHPQCQESLLLTGRDYFSLLKLFFDKVLLDLIDIGRSK